MFLYRLLCCVFFFVVMMSLNWLITSNGIWGYGFAVGLTAGLIFGAWAGTIERREKQSDLLRPRARVRS